MRCGANGLPEGHNPVPKTKILFGSEKRSPNIHVKCITNEKRGGLKVVAFDKSPFKLFTVRIFKQIGAGPIL